MWGNNMQKLKGRGFGSKARQWEWPSQKEGCRSPGPWKRWEGLQTGIIRYTIHLKVYS